MRAIIDEAGQQVEQRRSVHSRAGARPVRRAGCRRRFRPSCSDERLAKQVASERQSKRRETRLTKTAMRSMEDVISTMGQTDGQRVLNLVVKADVQVSVEALRDALTAIGTDQIRVNVIGSGVGGITESDATLAAASKAILIDFNVRADASAR